MKPKDEQKLGAITQATYACVLERGLSALTLADIARKAGLATSTLYVYYPAKQALLDALYEHAKTVTFASLIDGDSEQLPTKARVRLVWQHLLDLRLDNTAEVVFMEQYASSEYMSEPNRALSARLVAVFNALLERGQKEETLKPVPLPFLAGTVSASVQEVAKLIQQQVLPNDEATRATGFQLCWDAIKA
jgi:TetR/AcrR family transcriptional repressor of multidrug resistance operon